MSKDVIWLTWQDLSKEERMQAVRSYQYIRTVEEEEPCKLLRALKMAPWCRFERMPDGYIFVNV